MSIHSAHISTRSVTKPNSCPTGEFNPTHEEEARYIERSRQQTDALYLLALLGGRIVGILNFEPGTRRQFRHAGEFGMTVLQQHRGIGVGSALLDLFLEWARERRQITKLNLKVRADNQLAIALYKSRGFTVEGVQTRSVLRNGRHHDALWMGIHVD